MLLRKIIFWILVVLVIKKFCFFHMFVELRAITQKYQRLILSVTTKKESTAKMFAMPLAHPRHLISSLQISSYLTLSYNFFPRWPQTNYWSQLSAQNSRSYAIFHWHFKLAFSIFHFYSFIYSTNSHLTSLTHIVRSFTFAFPSVSFFYQ